MNQTPSTPSELFDLNSKPSYAKALEHAHGLSLNEAMQLVEEIITDLYYFHSSLIDEGDADPAVARVWEKECDSLLTARNAMRSVGRECECGECQ
jgi:hypothetical protein